jgi:pimeloyl-ACP methyl ester carboxylesterase
MYIEAKGLRFHVRDEGEGEPLLLLHGFPDSGRLWRHQVPVLTAADYRAVVPDLRGFGESDRPDGVGSYAMPLLVGDLVSMLDALGIERATVVGHDWGAAVGWTLAAVLPTRVTRLVALTVGHPSGFFADPIGQRERSWYMLFFQRGPDAAARHPPSSTSRSINRAHSTNGRSQAPVLRPIRSTGKSNPRYGAAYSRDGIVAPTSTQLEYVVAPAGFGATATIPSWCPRSGSREWRPAGPLWPTAPGTRPAARVALVGALMLMLAACAYQQCQRNRRKGPHRLQVGRPAGCSSSVYSSSASSQGRGSRELSQHPAARLTGGC